MIYVTHDQVEAMTLADKIVVLRDGHIEQVGSPLELYRNPDNKFVAGFIGSPGMNFLKGVVTDGGVKVSALNEQLISTNVSLPPKGSSVFVGVRPQNMSITHGSGKFSVDIIEQLGGVSYVYLNAPTGERVVVESKNEEDAITGSGFSISVDEESTMFFDENTDARLRQPPH
jgi:lactose/L-arabinose transport system ATP-binding protein